VADIALRISKALLNRKWFCTARRSTVNLFNLYATMLFIRNFVRNERNTNWRGTAKPSS